MDAGVDRNHGTRGTATWTVAAAVMFGFAVFIAVTGGFTTRIAGVRVSAHRVVPECVIGWLLTVLALRRYRPETLDANVSQARERLRRHSTVIGVILSVCTFAAGVWWGAFTAAGADPYGYISQAELWAGGNPVQQQPLIALGAPWPNAEWSFSPLGYKPSYVAGVMAPTYAPGLPLQMAVLIRLFGRSASFFAVPLLGALAVWLTYTIAASVCSKESALVSALLFACSPVFLFQLMQPMSDVPVTAWWLASVAFAIQAPSLMAFGAGLSASIATLTRPNLVPLLAPVIAIAVGFRWYGLRAAVTRAILTLVGAALGIALSAAVNATFFGSPLKSGYGSISDIYKLSYAGPNVVNYSLWLWQTYSPYIFLVCIIPLAALFSHFCSMPSFDFSVAKFGWLTLLFAAILGLCYVFYLPFDHWTCLRFLLPVFPLLLITATAVTEELAKSWPIRFRVLGLLVVASVLSLSYVHSSVRGDAFALKATFQDRYPVFAAFASTYVPQDGVVLCLLQSGSLRYYANRLTVRYDLIDNEHLGMAFDYLRAHGRTPYVAIEQTETPDFETRFPGLLQTEKSAGTPMIVTGRAEKITLFRPAKGK